MGNNPLCTSLEQSQRLVDLGINTKTADMFNAGCEILEKVIPLIPEKKQYEAKLLLNMGYFIRNAARTTVNVKEELA